jgi:hypothetical protein
VIVRTFGDAGRNFFEGPAVQVFDAPSAEGEGMSLHGNRAEIVDRSSRTAGLGRWLETLREATLMISMAVGVCLSWPQVARSMLLATKIVVYYCLSPR